MKLIIVAAAISFFLSLFLFNVSVILASSCSLLGNTSYCDDGTSYSRLGNTIYGSDGTSYTPLGNTIYGSDGSTATKLGNTTYMNDGTSYTQLGNTTYGSDGSSYTTLGNTTYGSGNTYTSCPTNSSYDSLTRKCKCNSGYVVSGSSCTYNYSYTPTYPTYSPISNNCPLNSHKSITDSTKCQCDSGYQSNLAKNGCVIVAPLYIPPPLNCASYGSGSYLGTDSKCYCAQGYGWNAGQTQCVQSVVCDDGVERNGTCLTHTQDCAATYGSNVYGTASADPKSASSCYCSAGYLWNATKTSCIATQSTMIPSSCEKYGAGATYNREEDTCVCLNNYQWNPSHTECIQGLICADGYQLNSEKTQCIVASKQSVNQIVSDQIIQITPVYKRNLTIGSKGNDVELLQKFLISKGLLIWPKGVMYGSFGSLTRIALKKLQAGWKLPVTGILDLKTRSALNSK